MSKIKVGDYVRSVWDPTYAPPLCGRVRCVSGAKAWITTDDNEDVLEYEDLFEIAVRPAGKEDLTMDLKLVAREGKLYPLLSITQVGFQYVATVYDTEAKANTKLPITMQEWEEYETATFAYVR